MVLLQQNPVRGFLVSVGVSPEIMVRFQFNPTEISDKRSLTYTPQNAPGLLLPVRQYSQGGDRTLSFKVKVDSLFDGPVPIARDEDGGITPELNKYRAFVYPQTPRWQEAGASFVPLYSENQQFVPPPLCRFGFGDRTDRGARIMDCIVSEISISEQLFNAQMEPLRAEVSITLLELAPYGNEPTPPPRGP
jgi:hypothetical protein